jgi:hypothetical protein
LQLENEIHKLKKTGLGVGGGESSKPAKSELKKNAESELNTFLDQKFREIFEDRT